MEWVETTARTVAEAKDSALDQLGVDEAEAEFEVLEEPRAGLFGRLRGEARVRARVAPKRPRPKAERKGRRRQPEQPETASPSGAAGAGSRQPAPLEPAADEALGGDDALSEDPVAGDPPEGGGDSATTRTRSGAKSGRSRGGAKAPRSATGRSEVSADRGPVDTTARKGSGMEDSVVHVEQQSEVVEAFLAGLLVAFGVVADVRSTRIDEETIELAVDGDDLGLLIGPKGQTLLAIQDLSRTVLQRRLTGRHEGRVRIDVNGYRQRRREALARFTEQVANEVKASGVQNALEPMGAADRKIVHDTANEIDGVATVSEGEDPRRRVVILPASD